MHCDAQSVIAVISLIPRKGFVLRNKNYCIVLYCIVLYWSIKNSGVHETMFSNGPNLNTIATAVIAGVTITVMTNFIWVRSAGEIRLL